MATAERAPAPSPPPPPGQGGLGGGAAAGSLMLVVLTSALYAVVPMSTDTYTPVLGRLETALPSTTAEVQWTLTAFMLAFGLFQLAWGPVSDAVGRRRVILAAFLVYAAATGLCLAAPTIEVLIAGRVLQGVGAAAGPAIGMAMIRDVYGARGAGRMFATISVGMSLAPLIGPLVAALLEPWLDWRAPFAVLLVYALGVLGLAALQPETARATGQANLRAYGRSYRILARRGPFLGNAALHALGYLGVFAIISGLTYILRMPAGTLGSGGLGLGALGYALNFDLVVIGYAAGAYANRRLVDRHGVAVVYRMGLVFSLAGAAAGLALWQAGVRHWPGMAPPAGDAILAPLLYAAPVVIPATVFMFGTGFTMPASMTAAVRPHPERAGAASALLGFIRAWAAAGLGAAVAALHDGAPGVMLSTMLGTALAATLLHGVLSLVQRGAMDLPAEAPGLPAQATPPPAAP